MHESQWYQYDSRDSRPLNIKVEAYTDSSLHLLSPPSSPSSNRDPPPPSSPHTLRRNTSSSSNKRGNPYPTVPRENRTILLDASKMAAAPAYGNWGSKSGSGRYPVDRRPSTGDQHASYGLTDAFVPMFAGRPADNIGNRPSSAGTSSLTGAIGDVQLSRHPGSQSPDIHIRRDAQYGPNMHQDISWSETSQSSPINFPGNGVQYNPSASTIPATGLPYSSYNDPKSYNIALESQSPPFPTFTDQEQFALQQQRGMAMSASPYPPSLPSSASSDDYKSPSMTQQDVEIRHLRRRVQELELINENARIRIKGLEAELAKDMRYGAQVPSPMSFAGPPSPLSTPSPQSPSFQQSWKARTDARVREFCSLNRAGNALCAWHDSRRERRAYPPRMAPPGHLNCGCTYDEALFEESLARHGVGSYHPGESVRMDPALRNPLLKLLQERYGYRDGDFERNPRTGEWVDGEGHAYWEQRVQTGLSHSRKLRVESDRR